MQRTRLLTLQWKRVAHFLRYLNGWERLSRWKAEGSRQLRKRQMKKGTKDHESPVDKSQDSVPPVLQPKTKPPPKPRRGIFCIVFESREKRQESWSSSIWPRKISQDKTESSDYKPSCTLRSEDDNILPQTSVLQTTRLQKYCRKNGQTKCEYPPQSETFDQVEISPGRLASLKVILGKGEQRT